MGRIGTGRRGVSGGVPAEDAQPVDRAARRCAPEWRRLRLVPGGAWVRAEGGYPPVVIAGVEVTLMAALLSFAMDSRPVFVNPALRVNTTSRYESGLAPSGA